MRKLRHLLIACVLCCFGVAVAAEMPAGVKVEKNGTFTVAEAKVQLKIYGENWARTTNAQWSDVKSAPGRGGHRRDRRRLVHPGGHVRCRAPPP